MSRFLITSLLAIAVFFSIGLLLQGSTRLWTFTAFWTIYLTMVGLGVSFIQLKFFGPNLCKGEPGQMKVALTFDDGPDPTATPALLDLLAREKISAAFFCIGKQVTAHPELAARIVADGHLLGNHTFNHYPWTPLLGRRELAREIVKTQEAILHAIGSTPTLMRPPIGLTNPIYPGVLKRFNLLMIGWSVRSMDTRWSAEKVIDRVLQKTTDGGIILLHDGGSGAAHVEQITTEIIRGLRDRGYEFERLDRLIGNKGEDRRG